MSNLTRRLCLALCIAGAAWFGSAPTAQVRAVSLQEQATAKFKDLHDRMQKLQVRKQATEPEESRVLQAGNRLIQEKRIVEGMERSAALIASSDYDQALEALKQVSEDLNQLLDLLLNRDVELQKLLEEIARLEKFKERVDQLVEEQRAEKEAAAETEALQKHLEELEKAKQEVDALIDRETELRGEANRAGLAAAPAEAQRMTEQQDGIRNDTDELQKRLEDLEKDAAELAAKPAAGAPNPGAPSPGKSAAGAGASGSAKGASGAMGQAGQSLQQNKPERSLQDMDQAVSKLEQTKQQLEQMAEDARRQLQQLPFDQQARAQEQTKIDTDRLAQDMEAAEQGDGEEAGKPTPGRKPVQQAVPKQRAAAGQLKEYKPGKAKQDQQDAVEDLEQAQKELEDALAQLRQQLTDEVLRSLEERFGAMLNQQKELSARTTAIDRVQQNGLAAGDAVPANVKRTCQELGRGEYGLGAEASDALKLLEEDGRTAAFPMIVAELRDDLNRVGERLDLAQSGTVTRQMQADIEATLKDLIDALRRTIEDRAGGGGCCGGSQPPLVPQSAELKLVMTQQKRVNTRTKEYDQAVPDQLRVTDEARDQAKELAHKQGRVEGLLREMAHRLEKEEAGNK
jgi:hypothetical protein